MVLLYRFSALCVPEANRFNRMTMKSTDDPHNSLQLLDLDEKLLRYWLTFALPIEKRQELEEHLHALQSRRLKLIRLPED